MRVTDSRAVRQSCAAVGEGARFRGATPLEPAVGRARPVAQRVVVFIGGTGIIREAYVREAVGGGAPVLNRGRKVAASGA